MRCGSRFVIVVNAFKAKQRRSGNQKNKTTWRFGEKLEHVDEVLEGTSR